MKWQMDPEESRERAQIFTVEQLVEHNVALIPLDSTGYLICSGARWRSKDRIDPKGNVFPFEPNRSRVGAMNRRLTEFQIRTTCRALIARDANLTGRQLRKELKSRFGAVGKTSRVFDLWRDETDKLKRAKAAATLPTEVAELQRRVQIAEAGAAENLKRAELAELREQAHQAHWALKIDELRRKLEEARAQNAAGQGASRVFPV
jgi:hypothetical protein